MHTCVGRHLSWNHARRLSFVIHPDGCRSDCIGRQVPWNHAHFLYWLRQPDGCSSGCVGSQCPGIEHASFRGDENLADAAVVALADKCPGVNTLKLCFVQEADGCSSDCVGRQVPWSHARRFWLLLRLEEFNESSLEAVKEHAHTLQF